MNKRKKKELLTLIKQYKASRLNEADQTINQIGQIAKEKSMMDMGKSLQKIFKKKDIYFALSPVAHYRIDYKGKTIIIVNKKYAENAELIVNDLAIGYQGKI